MIYCLLIRFCFLLIRFKSFDQMTVPAVLLATIWQAGKDAGSETVVASLTTCVTLPTSPLANPHSLLLLKHLRTSLLIHPSPLFGAWPCVPYLGVLARGCGRSAPDPPPAPSLERAGLFRPPSLRASTHSTLPPKLLS